MGERAAFFYGTLMAHEVLYRVCYGDDQVGKDAAKTQLASLLKIQPAILDDYSRRRVRFVDYPGITPQEGQAVRGTYVTGLTDGDIWRLDNFEGDEYTREKVLVAPLREDGTKGLKVEAETYVFTAGEDNLESIEWDFEEFRREKLHRWASTSDEYREVDALDEAATDPTGGRGVRSVPVEAVREEEALHAAV